MEPAGAQCRLKIEQLLEKLLKSKCQNKIDLYLDKLFDRLCSQEKKVGAESALITLPIFTEWITRAVTTWTSSRAVPGRFVLNLASLLSKDEARFTRLNSNNFFIKLVNLSKARQSEAPPSLQLAYINLLSSFLEHRSGIEWMIACRFWEDVFQLSLSSKNLEVAEESKMFICKILERVIDHDKEFCVNVIEKITRPLSEDIYKSIKFGSGCPETSEHLRLAGDVMEYFLERILFLKSDFRVLLLFWKNFQLEESLSEYVVTVQNKCNAFDLNKVVFIIQFLELYVNVVKKKLSPSETVTSVGNIINHFFVNLSKRDIDTFLKVCEFGHLYWPLMASKVLHFQSTKRNDATKFVNELTVLTLMPNFCLTLKYCYGITEFEDLLNDIFRDTFVDKLFQIASHSAIRICYVWRDFLVEQPNLFDISTKYLSCHLKLRKYLTREQGMLIFQSIMYILKDFMTTAKESPKKLEIIAEHHGYFCLVFEVLAVFINEFEITWKLGCEAIDVMVVSFDFLTLPVWFDEAVVKILKLIDISIAKYMSPNLALLVDRTSDSTIDLLGPLLYSKLHDVGKVKKAALEVVLTLANLSGKFPSLQKVLMDSELPTLVVKMSTCDGESFVRATAIKCLQEMIQVEEIWNNALISENLTQKMREILFNETEGIVRVEAATFMCIAYEHQQIPKDALEGIYETMIHSSTTDLHWEVKVRALDFWDKVIKNHLQNQGMIDGTFPNVTFSKEHRKIVTLTDSEIKKRLQKVLNQLSSIGCLGVLVSAIKDDCDIEVSKTAVKITQRLVELFKNYRIYGDSSAPTSPLPTENDGTSVPSVSSGISVDEAMDSPASYHPDFNEEVIDQIVNSKDVCLLQNVYSPSDYGSVINYDIQVKKIVTPAEFLQYTQQDLNNIITEKKNWLNGIEDLGSLLDDMLKTYDDDINNMDCY